MTVSPAAPRHAPRHVVLLGMMGVGKTTTGRALAHRLARPFRDCDEDLQTRTGRTGAQIAAADGVDHLHHLEEEVLLVALDAPSPSVVTGAGWVVESPRCRAALRERALVVWLDAPVADLAARVTTGDHRRPLPRAEAESVAARRRPRFAELADLQLDARQATPTLVDAIAAAVAEAGQHGRDDATHGRDEVGRA